MLPRSCRLRDELLAPINGGSAQRRFCFETIYAFKIPNVEPHDFTDSVVSQIDNYLRKVLIIPNPVHQVNPV